MIPSSSACGAARGGTQYCSAELLSNPKDVVSSPWVLSYDTTSISRSWVIKNWTEAIKFINAISDIAEHQFHHHPDIHLTNDRDLRIVLSTDSVGGLTQLDIDLAQAIDEISVPVSAKWLQEQQEAAVSSNGNVDDTVAAAVTFDQSHYQYGLNGDFVQPDARDKFYVNNGNGAPGIFENAEQRDIAAAKHEIVKALRLTEGMVVADVGAGTGLLEPLLSDAVGPTGKILVSELSHVFCEIIKERCQTFGNVHLMENPTDRDPKLPADGSVDLVLLVDVYHHLEYPQSVLRRIRQALDRHGVLIVIDFHRDPARIKSHDATWVFQHLRADQATFTREIETSGFVKVQEVNVPGLPENYCLVFRKRPIPLSEPGAGWTY